MYDPETQIIRMSKTRRLRQQNLLLDVKVRLPHQTNESAESLQSVSRIITEKSFRFGRSYIFNYYLQWSKFLKRFPCQV